ncbi:hypothetical protein Tco_0630093 [Tanacetum coccineum]
MTLRQYICGVLDGLQSPLLLLGGLLLLHRPVKMETIFLDWVRSFDLSFALLPLVVGSSPTDGANLLVQKACRGKCEPGSLNEVDQEVGYDDDLVLIQSVTLVRLSSPTIYCIGSGPICAYYELSPISLVFILYVIRRQMDKGDEASSVLSQKLAALSY